jgi:hypothetical protein
VSFFEADLEAQTVTVNGSASVEELLAALGKGGRDVRLIGQGSVAGVCLLAHGHALQLSDRAAGFDERLAAELGTDMRTLRQSLAAVAEFKGESWGHGALVGVVRFVQVRWPSQRSALLLMVLPGVEDSASRGAVSGRALTWSAHSRGARIRCVLWMLRAGGLTHLLNQAT